MVEGLAKGSQTSTCVVEDAKMFELWHKIEERGAVAIPARPEALSHLEWAEVAERMVRWDVLRYRQRYEFFFEREAYDVGVVRMLHDICRNDSGIDYDVGGGYENRELAVDGVAGMLSQHPYYSNIWAECGCAKLRV